MQAEQHMVTAAASEYLIESCGRHTDSELHGAHPLPALRGILCDNGRCIRRAEFQHTF